MCIFGVITDGRACVKRTEIKIYDRHRRVVCLCQTCAMRSHLLIQTTQKIEIYGNGISYLENLKAKTENHNDTPYVQQ